MGTRVHAGAEQAEIAAKNVAERRSDASGRTIGADQLAGSRLQVEQSQVARRMPVCDGRSERIVVRVGEWCVKCWRCQESLRWFACNGVLSASLCRRVVMRVHEHHAPGCSLETHEYGSTLPHHIT